MGRLAGWTLGVVFALAISVAPAAADTRWSVGVHIGSGPVYYPPVYREQVYYPPVYREPVYRERVYREPIYRPVYRERVVVVERRHDNGKHKGWYKHDRGRDRDWRDDRYDRDRRW